MSMRRVLAGACLAVTVAALACLNDTPVSPADAGIQLQLRTQVVGQVEEEPGANRTVEITVFYQRSEGDTVQLVTDPSSVTVAAGTTTEHSLTVQIGPCLADLERVGADTDGCQLRVLLRLLDAAGDTLDEQTIAPSAPVIPGQTVTTPSITLHASPPVLLLSTAAVAFSVAATDADPAPDSVGVTADRGIIRALHATVSYATEEPDWLSAAVSADTTPAQLVLTPTAQGLEPGSYTATVTVQSEATGLVPDPVTVDVALNVAQANVALVTMNPAADTVTIGDPPATLTAVPRGAEGQVLSGRVVQWTSSDPAVAAVSASSSLSTGDGATIDVSVLAPGSAFIRATVEGQSDSALVTVLVAPVATVTLTPAADTILVGDSTVISIAVGDAHGNILTDREINWTTDSSGVASLNAGTDTSITVMGVRQGGPVRIIATVEGVADTSLVTVVNPVSNVVARIDGEEAAVVQVGGAVVAGATLTDSLGNVLTGRSITWTSTNTAVATVDATTGDSVSVTTHFVGIAYIKATSEGKTDSVGVGVQPDTLMLALPNCPTPNVRDINDNDVVVGVCDDHEFSFTWSPTSGEVNIESPADSGFFIVEAVGINNSGEMALSIGRSDETFRPAIRTPGGNMVVLPLLPGGAYGTAAKINELGQVLGQSDTTFGGLLHTFVWTPTDSGGTTGTMVDVEAFGGALAGGTSDVTPVDINDAGDIVVQKDGAYYLIEPATRGGSTGTVIPLTGFLNTVAVNNHRQVAGDVLDPTMSDVTLAAVWESAGVTPLALLPNGRSANALDINDLGQIVGRVETIPFVDEVFVDPFIWTSATGMVDLGAGGTVHQAQAVNNQGIAVGDNGAQVVLWCTSAASVSVCLP